MDAADDNGRVRPRRFSAPKDRFTTVCAGADGLLRFTDGGGEPPVGRDLTTAQERTTTDG